VIIRQAESTIDLNLTLYTSKIMNKADAMAAITITKMTLRSMQHLFSFMHAHKANRATSPKMAKYGFGSWSESNIDASSNPGDSYSLCTDCTSRTIPRIATRNLQNLSEQHLQLCKP